MDEYVDPVLTAEHDDERVVAELAIEAAGIGTFDWDLESGRLDWDDRLVEIFGLDPASFDRTIEGFYARLHPGDLPRITEAVQASIDDCGDFGFLYRVLLPDGATRWVSARGRVLCDPDGRATRLLGAAYDVTDQRTDGDGVARVLEAMPAGFYSLDRDWRFTHVNAEAERLLGCSRDQLLGRIVWDCFPAAVNSTFEENFRHAVASGAPVAFDAHYPEPLNGWYELRAWPTPDGLSVYFLEVTARRQAQERVVDVSGQLALLARVSRELAGSLSAEVATQRLPQLVVPALADGCIVTVVDMGAGTSGVGSWHADDDLRPVLERYARDRPEQLPAIAPAGRAVPTGDRVVVSGTDAVGLLAPGHVRDLLTRLAPVAMVGVPLRGRGRTLGLMTLFFATRQPTAEDLATAQDVADRTGMALDNARLYGRQQQLAEQLQRSFLTAPPEPDHAEVVVRYLPAAEAAAVGGDWYDAFLQRDGATTLVIGDVAGHDTAAAATMGQLRGLLRGIATVDDRGPAAVLSGLDSSMALLRIGTLATAAVARFEQSPEDFERGVTRMRWSSAGHLPPFAISAGGRVAALGGWRSDLILGVDPDTERSETVVTLERGATVLLYTDGLVERRDADLDAGMARLQAALEELADRPLQELCDLLLERLVDGRPDDDVALVAVRLHRQDRPRPASAGPNSVPDEVPDDPAVPEGR